ncbi:protein MRG1-like isoform X2 [Rhododendron vialii]|uniref:protein MRG1-like isoform X2 n=1 Tax=Rhododendron vialii TaxID=182163 RepID=UPI00265E0FD6|nr:protein MRG1-like isoform X2 [Rhododendron vialii]
MGSSTAGVTVTDDSAAAISDEDGATTDTDVDVKGAVDSSLPSDPSPFSQGEKVLAFFQNHVYPAKVQKVDVRLKEWRFYVHYLGWKKSWDEWVSMDRLMKFTEENVQKQVVFNKKKSTEKITKTGVARGKKRKIDSVEKEKDNLTPEKLLNILLPSTLKKQLVDDCEFITHLGKLVRLPRNPNVDDILKKYLDHRLKKDGAIADSIEEILNGLRCYFDKALPAMLLYKSERQQYQDATADHVSPSTVYGAEHLLRLFVKLPEMLYYANIEEETLKELQQKLLDFLKFLQKNQSSFFLSTYQTLESSDACTKKQDD